MAVVINIGEPQYIGTLKSTAQITPGVFVTPNYATGTATAVADNAAGDESGLLLVCNVNPNIDEQGVDDASFTVGADEYLRLKAPNVGDVFTTDQFIPTYSSVNVGDKMAVGAGGKVDVIGTRTPALVLRVIEKTTLYGNNALKLIVEKN
jgi:hypothetical protein